MLKDCIGEKKVRCNFIANYLNYLSFVLNKSMPVDSPGLVHNQLCYKVLIHHSMSFHDKKKRVSREFFQAFCMAAYKMSLFYVFWPLILGDIVKKDRCNSLVKLIDFSIHFNSR